MLLLPDISMPVMDGLTSTREMRKFEKQNKLPGAIIIALTAATGDSSREEGFANGCDLYFTKPVPLEEIKAIIDGWQAKV
jgi:CheY-like chemotaxis protein